MINKPAVTVLCCSFSAGLYATKWYRFYTTVEEIQINTRKTSFRGANATQPPISFFVSFLDIAIVVPSSDIQQNTTHPLVALAFPNTTPNQCPTLWEPSGVFFHLFEENPPKKHQVFI